MTILPNKKQPKWEREYLKRFKTKESKPKDILNDELSKIAGRKMSCGTITKVMYTHAADPEVIKFIRKQKSLSYQKGRRAEREQLRNKIKRRIEVMQSLIKSHNLEIDTERLDELDQIINYLSKEVV